MDTVANTKDYKGINKLINIGTEAVFRIIVLGCMFLKTIMFLALLESKDTNLLPLSSLNIWITVVQAAFITLVSSFGFLFSQKRRLKFYIALNMIYSLVLILDLWYFRVNKDFLGIKNIFYTGTFNPMGEYLVRPKTVDIVFIADIVLMIFLLSNCTMVSNNMRNISRFIRNFTLSVLVIFISYVLFDIIGIGRWDEKLFKVGWSPLVTMRVPGPIGYHCFEMFNTINKLLHKSTDEEKKDLESWLSQNHEQLEDNKYKGLFQGKNVIFLQLESFENFVIDREVNNKEITPFLNKLSKEGLYFSNIYEQNNGGNSIDCDFMVNTSVLPLGNSITALTNGQVVYEKSLPRLLKQKGYTTISSHAEAPGEFNWTELHKNGFGVDLLWDISKYKYEETVGYGLSDRSFLNQLSDKIKTLPQPFYINAATLSSHGPFKIGKEYRELNLPKEIDESYLGGYFESVHYTDRQVEMFIRKLDEEGILEDTVIVIYGDHAGVHKYYNDDIQGLNFEGNWWSDYDHEIPLIMYSKGSVPERFEVYGGHIDIMPTILYLLGTEDSQYRDAVMGRVLVNTKRNATVIKGNIIKGETFNHNEKEHLLNSYTIGEKIIRNAK